MAKELIEITNFYEILRELIRDILIKERESKSPNKKKIEKLE
jgi:hypothetical protein